MQDEKLVAFLSKALKGKSKVIITLEFLLEQKVGTARQHKCQYKLVVYDFILEYKRGKENKVANTLTRKEEYGKDESIFLITFPEPVWLYG